MIPLLKGKLIFIFSVHLLYWISWVGINDAFSVKNYMASNGWMKEE
jgi:hypothetical protein